MRELPPHFSAKIIERDNKQRLVGRPDAVARLENNILLNELSRKPFPECVTGGLRGRDLVDNIKPHVHNTHFYLLDIKDAYLSVDAEHLAGILGVFPARNPASPYYDAPARAEVRDAILHSLREFHVDSEGGLILGAPASPILFNVYCHYMDARLMAYCLSEGLTYTRYLDDITISAPQDATIGRKKRASIRDIIIKWGRMEINHAKSRVHSLENGPVTITGISLYPDGRWQPSPTLFEKIVTTFNEIEAKLNAFTQLTPEDIGKIHGYHSVLVNMRDPSSKKFTLLERELRAQYGKLCTRLRLQRQLVGGAAIQLAMFE